MVMKHAGRAARGSQYILQNYIMFDQEKLNNVILNSCPTLKNWLLNSPYWVSPRMRDNFEEYQDRKFLDKVNLSDSYPQLKQFWPNGGPVWDGLATVSGMNREKGVILVEAKSHLGEVINLNYSCRASPKSRTRIDSSLNVVKSALGVREQVDWLGDVYQHANRIAHLYFLRFIAKIPSWLIFLYFVGDKEQNGPDTRSGYTETLTIVNAKLGLPDKHMLSEYMANVFIETWNWKTHLAERNALWRPQVRSNEGVFLLLSKDFPIGSNNAFAPSLAAWHRMVLKKANYICEKCNKEIELHWGLHNSKKIARNHAHHIISELLADWFGKPDLKLLLACGRAYCEDCHYDEHVRVGGYEWGGAKRAFSRFNGLEKISDGLAPSDIPGSRKSYNTFLHVALEYKPEFRPLTKRYYYDDQAQIILSAIFYQNVYKELDLLGWDKMSEWKSDELERAVDKANEKWWEEDTEYLLAQYNRLCSK